MAKKKNDTKALSDQEMMDLLNSINKDSEEIKAIQNEVAVDSVTEAPVQSVKKEAPKQQISGRAFGLHKNKETNKYEIVELSYDMSKGTAEIESVLRTETSLLVAQNRVSEAVARVANGLKLDSMRKKTYV